MTERQQVESSTAWRPPPRMSGGRRLTGGKAVREAAGLIQIAAGGDLASHRQERVGRGIEVPDREVHGRPSATCVFSFHRAIYIDIKNNCLHPSLYL